MRERTARLIHFGAIGVATLIALILIAVTPALANGVTLPASAWYAVTWNQTTDTLHWSNSATEITSIPRPKLPNENLAWDSTGSTVYISPNGRTLVVTAPLNNQNYGIGFYDLESGQFIQTHEAQPGEYVVYTEETPFSLNSEIVTVGLYSANSWRAIAFEVETGNAIAQVTPQEANAVLQTPIASNLMPYVQLIDVDEGFGQYRVHLRFMPQGFITEGAIMPQMTWMPEAGTINEGVLPADSADWDVLPQTGQTVFTSADGALHNGIVGHDSTMLYSQVNQSVYQPRWLYNGQFIGFRVFGEPYAPMWHLMSSVGGQSLPFGPDYDMMYGTSDGFLIVDLEAPHVKYSNTFQFEAFTPTVGNVIYSAAPGQSIRVIYVTPIGATFSLPSVEVPQNGVDVVGGVDLQAPLVPDVPPCEGAPAARLTVGAQGRVSFTNGQPLNIRNAANGERIGQLPEGTVFSVLAGPECANGYRWWSVQTVDLSGWVAEGDLSEYFVEPFTLIVQANPIQPTATPLRVQVAPLATATAPPLARVPLLPSGDGDCSLAVEQQVQVNAGAVAVQQDGTLAFRINLNDEFPTHQISAGTVMHVIGGPICDGGHRMWQVEVDITPGNTVTGFLSEGIQGRRYLSLPRRAGS